MNKLRKIPTILMAVLLIVATATGQSDQPTSPQPKQTQLLFPEGFRVGGREATLARHPEQPRWFLQFTTTGATPATDPLAVPLEVLPGKWLTNMIRFAEQQQDQTARFRVWGEITTYHNRNYIMPTFAAALSLFGDDSGDQASPAEPSEDDKSLETDELRKAIMALPRTRPLQSTDSLSPAPPPPSTGTGSDEAIWKDGYMIINRVGRISYYPEAQQWLFSFEADAASLAEPPVELLPSQLLAMLEQLQAKSSRPLRFRISGQVTKYQSRNYVLLRKALVVYDLGNLGG